MWHVHEGIRWWMIFGGVATCLFWVGVMGLVVWSIATLITHTGSGSRNTEKQNPLDIAKARYARGEINKEQFDEIKRGLL